MGSLVTHVCSGMGGEVDMALELLCGLVTEKPSEMALYAVFVKVTLRSNYLLLMLKILNMLENCINEISIVDKASCKL